MNISMLPRLELSPGDVVVTAVQYRDYVVVVTQQGELFRLTENQL